jgi:tetratricopeptide (TPR) repeat protein
MAVQTPAVTEPAPTATPVLLLVTEDGDTDVEPLAEDMDRPTPDQQKMLDKIASDMIVDSTDSLLERGEVYLMAGEQGIDPAYDLGIADLTEVLKEQPEHPIALRYRGMAYTRTGKLKEAIADHQKLIEVKPNDPYAYIVCASLLTEAGKDEEAIGVYDNVLEIGGKSAENARFNRGKAYMRLNQKDMAKGDFEYLAKNAENPKILEESKSNLERLSK